MKVSERERLAVIAVRMQTYYNQLFIDEATLLASENEYTWELMTQWDNEPDFDKRDLIADEIRQELDASYA